jgi:hypothetical protein
VDISWSVCLILELERINMKKIVVINEKSKRFYFKNREVRTPVELEVTDQELKSLAIVFKMADIQKYIIKTQEKPQKSNPLIEFENTEVLIEELDLEDSEEEQKSILEKLMIETGEKDERD